jgi:hypothetical protein
VKLHLEKGIGRDVISRELGVGESSVSNWVKSYLSRVDWVNVQCFKISRSSFSWILIPFPLRSRNF